MKNVGKIPLYKKYALKLLLLPVISLLCFTQTFGQKKIIVAQDGSGNYTKVQDAFNAVPTGNKDTIIIYVKKGIYKERLVLDTRKDFVKLV